MPSELLGLSVAFCAAAVATLVDSYFTMAKSLPRVPDYMALHPGPLILAAGVGCIAGLAFHYTDPAGTDVISTALTLKQSDPVLRGLIVGGSILVLLRSRIFNVQDTGAGLEALYTWARSTALQAVNDTRTRNRTRFLHEHLAAAFEQPSYFRQLEDTIVSAMETRPSDLRQRAGDQLAAVKARQPARAMAASDSDWEHYYRSMTAICIDYCGAGVLEAIPGFGRQRRAGWVPAFLR